MRLRWYTDPRGAILEPIELQHPAFGTVYVEPVKAGLGRIDAGLKGYALVQARWARRGGKTDKPQPEAVNLLVTTDPDHLFGATGRIMNSGGSSNRWADKGEDRGCSIEAYYADDGHGGLVMVDQEDKGRGTVKWAFLRHIGNREQALSDRRRGEWCKELNTLMATFAAEHPTYLVEATHEYWRRRMEESKKMAQDAQDTLGEWVRWYTQLAALEPVWEATG